LKFGRSPDENVLERKTFSSGSGFPLYLRLTRSHNYVPFHSQLSLPRRTPLSFSALILLSRRMPLLSLTRASGLGLILHFLQLKFVSFILIFIFGLRFSIKLLMFVFQYLLHLTDYSILLGCNRIYFCNLAVM